MTYTTPRGHVFADKTLAMVDLLLSCPRLRATWAPEPGDLRMLAAIDADRCRRSRMVNAIVDAILLDGGVLNGSR